VLKRPLNPNRSILICGLLQQSNAVNTTLTTCTIGRTPAATFVEMTALTWALVCRHSTPRLRLLLTRRQKWHACFPLMKKRRHRTSPWVFLSHWKRLLWNRIPSIPNEKCPSIWILLQWVSKFVKKNAYIVRNDVTVPVLQGIVETERLKRGVSFSELRVW